MANRIVVMHRGVIQQVGTPAEVYSLPANTFVATFVGSPPMNLLPGRLEARSDGVLFRGPIDLPIGAGLARGLAEGLVTLGIRPEHVQVVDATAQSALPVRIELVERVGPDSYLVAQLGEGCSITLRVDAASPIREGDGVAIELPWQHLRIFDAAGERVRKEQR